MRRAQRFFTEARIYFNTFERVYFLKLMIFALKRISRQAIFLIICLASLTCAGQNVWMPDSSAYEYLCNGKNSEQFYVPGLTSISTDANEKFHGHSSIRWDIPANSGSSTVYLDLGDKDLRNKVLYRTCKRNNLAGSIIIYLETTDGSKFKIGTTTLDSTISFRLPETEWQQLGSSTSENPLNGANPAKLQHCKRISFVSSNAGTAMSLWIGEIKIISPTGPACIVHFNRYRDQADTLLTPYLLEHSIRANIDFNFDFAKNETEEDYSGFPFHAIGFQKIDSLVKHCNWSTTSHGTFYDYLTYLSAADRYRLCSPDSFIAKGFDVQWCFSIPKDKATASIMKEIRDFGFYKCIRKQGQGLNQLPIDNPDRLQFFRPTSASAGPNLNGTPLSRKEMKHFVDSTNVAKGLIILDFGTLVTSPSNLYTDVETTMLSDATSLINYTASLNIPFITFKDLLASDPGYQVTFHACDDYVLLKKNTQQNLFVLENDVSPSGTKHFSAIINSPVHGSLVINAGMDSIKYTPSGCFDYDSFKYVSTDGITTDTADVIIKRTNFSIHADRTSFCSPNFFNLKLNILGASGPKFYAWSNGSTAATINNVVAGTYIVTVTDSSNCKLRDTIILSSKNAPSPFITNSSQCGPGIPTCSAISNGTIRWYNAAIGGNLLQNGGSTYLTSISNSTTFYVSANYAGCSSARVEVNAVIEKPFVGIELTGDTLLCAFDSSTILSAVCDPGMNYKWYFNNTPIPDSDFHLYYPDSTGYYYLRITRLSDNCIAKSDSIHLTKNPNFNLTVIGSTQFCAGDSILLMTSSGYNGLYHQWFRNDTLIHTGTDTIIAVYTGGTYYVEVNLDFLCLRRSENIRSEIVCTVSVDENNAFADVNLYPNPATGNTTLTFNNSKSQYVTIDLFSVNGQISNHLYAGNIHRGTNSFSIVTDEFPQGIYCCVIRSETGVVQRKLVLIK